MVITCGAFVYDAINQKFLICHVTRTKNLWSIPKGLPDNNERYDDAAKRELFEETNINIDEYAHTNFLKLPDSLYTKQKKTLISFLVIVEDDLSAIKLKCNSLVDGKFPEVDRFEWVELEGLAKLHESQSILIPHLKNLLNNQSRNK